MPPLSAKNQKFRISMILLSAQTKEDTLYTIAGMLIRLKVLIFHDDIIDFRTYFITRFITSMLGF